MEKYEKFRKLKQFRWYKLKSMLKKVTAFVLVFLLTMGIFPARKVMAIEWEEIPNARIVTSESGVNTMYLGPTLEYLLYPGYFYELQVRDISNIHKRKFSVNVSSGEDFNKPTEISLDYMFQTSRLPSGNYIIDVFFKLKEYDGKIVDIGYRKLGMSCTYTSKRYRTDVPKNLRWKGFKLEWDQVEMGDSRYNVDYAILVYGADNEFKKEYTTTSTSYTFTEDEIKEGDVAIMYATRWLYASSGIAATQIWKEPPLIENVNVDIREPVAGETAGEPSVSGDSDVLLYEYSWYGYAPGSETKYKMSSYETFVEGRKYYADITVKSSSGRMFLHSPSTFRANGNSVDFVESSYQYKKENYDTGNWENAGTARVAHINPEFTAKAKEKPKIDNIEIRVDPPVEGNLPSEPVSVTKDVSISRFDWCFAEDGVTVGYLSPGDRFMPGREYALSLVLEADGDRKIEEDAPIRVNGELNKWNPYYTYDEQTVYVDHMFTAKGDENARYNVNISPTILNGSVVADKYTNISPGDTVTLTVTPDDGYVLDYLEVNDDGAVGVPMESEDTFEMPWSNVIVGAAFKPIPVDAIKVEFETNGGSKVLPQVLERGHTATVPTKPVKYGHIFEGWYEDAEFNTAFDFTTAITEDKTLYAKWREFTVERPTVYTVTFEGNGHGMTQTANVEDGRKAIKPPAQIDGSYKVEGWYTESECVNEYDFDTAVTGDITLYAKWVEIEFPDGYTVTFDGNGHGSTRVQNVLEGSKVLKPESPSKEGYALGENRAKTCLPKDYGFDTVVNSNITLFAKWTKNEDKVNPGENPGNNNGVPGENPGNNNTNPGDNNGNAKDNPVATPSQINPGGGSSGGGGSRGGGGGGTSSRKSSVGSDTVKKQGQWQHDAIGWWYKNADGSYPKNAWQNIDGVWYAFNGSGYMITGWFLSGDKWYYLDATQGGMKTGWQIIEGKYYYFATDNSRPTGAMYKGEKTPDGYNVDENGVWTAGS